jgi:hypothetical protein
VVEIQVFSVKRFAAVLAGVFVALEDVVAGELHFFARHPVEKDEQNYARNADAPAGCLHHVRVGLALAKIAPAFKVVRREASIIGVHNLRLALAQKRESPAGGADVNRLPQPVQNQNVSIEEHRNLGNAGGT